MISLPLLSILLILPLLGALIILPINSSHEVGCRNIRQVALLTSLATFVLSLLLWSLFDSTISSYQFSEFYPWIGDDIGYRLGLDGISILFVVLTAFLVPLCILASWHSITTHLKEYMVAFLVLETLMIGVFSALDFFLFYIFFEGVLIPMFLIIGIWGGPRRVYASFKFFLYTLLGSVLMLVAILYMYSQVGTTSIPAAAKYIFDPHVQTWLWFAFLASFAVKLPMWPVHTWLPDAHVEAPTAGSVILAGVLLKMGGYGFLRFSLPMFPQASQEFAWLIFALSLVAIVYTSLVALVQDDMKKLIAYSSIAHMGFVTIGIFVFNQQGIEGALFQMLSHGLISGALFLCVGIIYDRLHTREIARYGGLVQNMPRYATVLLIISLGAVGLPGTTGFVGEILVLFGAYHYASWLAFVAATGVILSAAYMLYLYWRVAFGKLIKADVREMNDIGAREVIILSPLVVLVIWFGIYPTPVLSTLHASTTKLIQGMEYKLASLTDENHFLENNSQPLLPNVGEKNFITPGKETQDS